MSEIPTYNESQKQASSGVKAFDGSASRRVSVNFAESSKDYGVDGDKKSDRFENFDVAEAEVHDNRDQLQRHLSNRQIQLIAIGGSIGTALFVSINSGLYHGGPGSLLIAYLMYSIMLGLVNNCVAEMTTYMPVSGGFIRLAGKWVDEAFGFMAGWNFFLYEALLIPFEISALNLVLSYWVSHEIGSNP